MLRSLRIRYDPTQDRLILGLDLERDGVAFRHALSLTRRLWRRARLDLQAMLDLSAAVPAMVDGAARQALSAANHQTMAALTPTRVARSGRSDAPAQQPDLVVGLTCGRRRRDSRWALTFKLEGKDDLTLVLGDRGLHAMAGALIDRESATGWDLPALPASKPATQEPNRALH